MRSSDGDAPPYRFSSLCQQALEELRLYFRRRQLTVEIKPDDIKRELPPFRVRSGQDAGQILQAQAFTPAG